VWLSTRAASIPGATGKRLDFTLLFEGAAYPTKSDDSSRVIVAGIACGCVLYKPQSTLSTSNTFQLVEFPLNIALSALVCATTLARLLPLRKMRRFDEL
jgi:hypothetical protein